LLDEVCDAQKTPPSPGDILLVRTGWLSHYFGIRTGEQRRAFSSDVRASGTLRWLWDHQFSVIAFDNVGVELCRVLRTRQEMHGDRILAID